MSRYIDEKWLEDNAKEYSLGYYEYDEWATPLNVLDSAPSIDIVFCKECKLGKWCRSNGEFYLWCRPNIKRVKENDFCSCGKRRKL